MRNFIPGFSLVLFFYSSAVLVVHVPFPFGVWGRVRNSIVPVPDLCLFIYYVYVVKRSSLRHC